MEPLTDIRLWILMGISLIWILRTKRALTTLKLVPQIQVRNAKSEDSLPKVSVIIPAKNEEDNIQACVEGFLSQDYPNLEILVINDNSTDRTGEILDGFGGAIKVVQSAKTPNGWTGKNFALHQAIPQVTGDWYLFTDADTRHDPASVSSVITHVQEQQLALLTLTPRCLTGSFIENLIQPAAMAHTGLWFPLERVNQPNTKDIFGNGQYLMIQRKHYEKIGGHQAVKGEFLEDFALVRKTKHAGKKFQCALGTSIYGTRMYSGLDAIWNGWRRIFLHAFERKPKILLSKFLSVILFSIIPFTIAFPTLDTSLRNPQGHGAALGITLVLLCVIWVTAWKAYGLVKGKRMYALLYPAACFFLAVILLDAWWMALRKTKTVWR